MNRIAAHIPVFIRKHPSQRVNGIHRVGTNPRQRKDYIPPNPFILILQCCA
jgi:hypothetical protein